MGLLVILISGLWVRGSLALLVEPHSALGAQWSRLFSAEQLPLVLIINQKGSQLKRRPPELKQNINSTRRRTKQNTQASRGTSMIDHKLEKVGVLQTPTEYRV